MHFAVVQVSMLINGADDAHKSCVCMLGLFIKSLELCLVLAGLKYIFLKGEEKEQKKKQQKVEKEISELG